MGLLSHSDPFLSGDRLPVEPTLSVRVVVFLLALDLDVNSDFAKPHQPTSRLDRLQEGKSSAAICRLLIGDPTAMLELFRLSMATLLAAAHSRRRLVVENLLLRQQLQVALRFRRRPCLRAREKLFWLLARRLHQDWRRHLLLVRPETVLAWHRWAGASSGAGGPATRWDVQG